VDASHSLAHPMIAECAIRVNLVDEVFWEIWGDVARRILRNPGRATRTAKMIANLADLRQPSLNPDPGSH
jgi:hypothetical protein